MKKLITGSMAAALLLLVVSTAGAFDVTGKVGAGIDAGLIIPAGGDVTADSSISDIFNVGPTFGLHVGYGITKEISLKAGFGYAFMSISDDANADPDNEPHLTMPNIYLNGVLNLGSFINKENNMFNPFFEAGPALYFWKVTDDGAGGDAIVLDNNEELKKTSFGLNFGAGLDIFATPDLAISAEGKYHLIFSEDEDAFGPDFGNMNILEVKLGLTYYFPLASGE